MSLCACHSIEAEDDRLQGARHPDQPLFRAWRLESRVVVSPYKTTSHDGPFCTLAVQVLGWCRECLRTLPTAVGETLSNFQRGARHTACSSLLLAVGAASFGRASSESCRCMFLVRKQQTATKPYEKYIGTGGSWLELLRLSKIIGSFVLVPQE